MWETLIPGRTSAMAIIMPPISWISKFDKPSFSINKSDGRDDIEITINIPRNIYSIWGRVSVFMFAFLYKNGIPARIIITKIIFTIFPYFGLSSKDVTNFANMTKPIQADITN